MDLQAQLAASLAEHLQAPRWWLALSGGSDSLSLLYLLAEYRQRYECPPIHAIHVHHGIAAEADAWAALCARHCERLDIVLTVVHTDPIDSDSAGLEAAAREARYGVFTDLLVAGERLLMAHHLDDQVETVLFRLLRGAGPHGLSGMPATRALGKGQLLRPLLEVPRSVLEDFLEQHVASQGLDVVEDPANQDRRFDRNFLRHEVLPLIASRWPGYRTTVARSASLLRPYADAGDLAALAPNPVGEPMLALSPEWRPERLATDLHRWLVGVGQPSPDRRRLEEFAQQCLSAARDRSPSLTVGNACLRRWRAAVHLGPEQPAAFAGPCTLEVGQPLSGPWGSLHWQTALDDPGLPPGLPMQARPRREGERVTPMGRPSRPLSQWWQELDMPPWWRASVPLLCDDQDNVLALPGGGLTALAESYVKPYPQSGDIALLPVWRPPEGLSELSA